MRPEKNCAAKEAYDFLYGSILSGALPLGTPISEVEVGKTLGISRSPVREALKKMESEGLVFHFHGRGTFVADITQRDIDEIFELRIMLELHSLRSAIRYFDESILNELEKSFLDLDEDSEPQQYYDANKKLHTSIIVYGGNQRLEKFYNMLSAQFAIINRISSRDPEHFSTSKQRHLAIVEAIKKGDVDAAEKALEVHLKQVWERTISEYGEPIPLKERARLI